MTFARVNYIKVSYSYRYYRGEARPGQGQAQTSTFPSSQLAISLKELREVIRDFSIERSDVFFKEERG